jgi:regulator of replication initiation timing
MVPEEYIRILTGLNEQIQQLNVQVEELEQRNQALEAENKQLQEMLHEKGTAKGAKLPVFKENYSVEQQTKKRANEGGMQRGGEVKRIS